MIVLSVYYITTDPDDYAFEQFGEDNPDSETAAPGSDVNKEEADGADGADDADVENISQTHQDELFTMLRMKIQDERSMKKDRLKGIVTSGTATVDEKNEAMNAMDDIDEMSTKESILEQSIIAQADYQDVFVRSEDNKVQVHVLSQDLTREEVVNIMQMVRDEFGDITVKVNHETTES